MEQFFSTVRKNALRAEEDAEVGQLCGPAPPHPVRCPVITCVGDQIGSGTIFVVMPRTWITVTL